jgi:peptidyl-prolyl cis-trans isomerase B (cyclophilin B)
MIQGGGFEWKDGLAHKQGKAPIKGEFKINGVENEISHMPGVISMARTMFKDSATSQFFICVDDASFLDGQYAGFGKVSDEESLSNAIEIGKVDTGNWQYYGDVPTTPVVIKTIRRI